MTSQFPSLMEDRTRTKRQLLCIGHHLVESANRLRFVGKKHSHKFTKILLPHGAFCWGRQGTN